MKSSTAKLIIIVTFSIFAVWWLILQLFSEPSDFALELFSGLYGLTALFGGIIGIKISKKWGGWKSYLGRALLMLSVGLLLQEFGQIAYSLYTLILHNEIPYPSIGDIGYFGAIPAFIYGTWLIGRTVNAKYSLKTLLSRLQALILPIVVVGGTYWYFLKDYSADGISPLVVILDHGYPIGPAIYISLAVIVFMSSRKYLSGLLRPAILATLLALTFQYLTDFVFLYQNHNETWVTAGFNEFMYLFAYFVMALALIRFNSVLTKLSNNKEDADEPS